MSVKKEVSIKSNGFWLKIVGMLQHNWAVIEMNKEGKVLVYFIGDNSVIFDHMNFNSQKEVIDALLFNEFIKFEEHLMKEILLPPQKPYEQILRPIYSSGEYWEDY